MLAPAQARAGEDRAAGAELGDRALASCQDEVAILAWQPEELGGVEVGHPGGAREIGDGDEHDGVPIERLPLEGPTEQREVTVQRPRPRRLAGEQQRAVARYRGHALDLAELA